MPAGFGISVADVDHMTKKTSTLVEIQTFELEAVTGGAGDNDPRFAQFAVDNAQNEKRRLQLFQQGQLDREDLAFFADNQKRAAQVIRNSQPVEQP